MESVDPPHGAALRDSGSRRKKRETFVGNSHTGRCIYATRRMRRKYERFIQIGEPEAESAFVTIQVIPDFFLKFTHTPPHFPLRMVRLRNSNHYVLVTDDNQDKDIGSRSWVRLSGAAQTQGVTSMTSCPAPGRDYHYQWDHPNDVVPGRGAVRGGTMNSSSVKGSPAVGPHLIPAIMKYARLEMEVKSRSQGDGGWVRRMSGRGSFWPEEVEPFGQVNRLRFS